MNTEFYVWDTEQQAQAALDYINNSGWFPIVGHNAANEKPQPDKQKTTKWADEVLQRVDGRWCFEKIPSSKLDYIGVSLEDRQAFLNAFSPSIEEYQDGWFLSGE